MRLVKREIKPKVQVRASMTEPQAEQLQQRLSALPFRVESSHEKQGTAVMVVIACTGVQEKFVRNILHEVEASVPETGCSE